ncbi:MAG TPA: hypothetical protein VGQ60_01110 [Nitrospiraceae bacterium]|jgi:hypothetical protein|nr:hypothetical protein [Nitrospiraceae bacterium]
MLAIALLLFAALSMPAGAAEPQGLHQMTAAMHVHTNVSTGTLSLDEVAAEAERLGLDAVVLSDNLVLRYEYGLFPLRGVFRRWVNFPSVLDFGIERYLNEVKAVQARHPHVLLVPGVEVAPHYHWSGSLFNRNLTMHDSQKNLLVLGLQRADDFLGLPVAGLPGAYQYGWGSTLNVMPVLLLVPTLWLWRKGGASLVVLEGVAHRYRAFALILGGLTMILLLNAWPFAQPAYSIYDERSSYQPYQSFIDGVSAHGGVAIWSMPEARDFNRHTVGPFTITVKTDPYPEALILTAGYTAFGGLYEDTRKAINPGGIWDQAIQLYLSGERPIPPFLTGESAYHGPGQADPKNDKLLDRVLTVLRVRERTPAGLIEAIRTGRLYAVEQTKREFGLRLDTFRVECDGGSRGAESGEMLDPEGARDLAVRVAVSASDERAHPLSVNIIRSGQVVAKLTGETPFTQVFEDAAVPPGQWHAYRIVVRGDRESGELLSNPVFVGPVPAPEPPAAEGKS